MKLNMVNLVVKVITHVMFSFVLQIMLTYVLVLMQAMNGIPKEQTKQRHSL